MYFLRKVVLIVNIIGVTLFLFGYYYLMYVTFIKKYSIQEFPALRVRWGTMMSHSSDGLGRFAGANDDPNAVQHIYCYYPKSETQYPNKAGGYIIKRQDDGNCEGWFGKAVFSEGWWVSEREKLWWSLPQKLEEDLKTANTEAYQM